MLLIVRTNTNCENMGCDLLGLRNIQQNNQYDTLIKRTQKGPWLRELPTWRCMRTTCAGIRPRSPKVTLSSLQGSWQGLECLRFHGFFCDMGCEGLGNGGLRMFFVCGFRDSTCKGWLRKLDGRGLSTRLYNNQFGSVPELDL